MNPQLHLPTGVRWSWPLVGTGLLCAVALGFAVREGYPLVVALIQPSADLAKVDVTTPLLDKHQEVHSMLEKRVENRYLFSIPPNWKRKAPPPPPPTPRPVEPIKPPEPPPPPANYTGPAVAGIFGSTVYFKSGKTADVGKEVEGVTVVEIVSSWKLKLKHMGKVYDVTFGEPLPDDLFKPSSQRAPSVPGLTLTNPPSAPGSTTTPPGAASSTTAPTTGGAQPAGATQPGAAPARAVPPAEPVAPPSPSVQPASGSAGVPEPLDEGKLKTMKRDDLQTALRQRAVVVDSKDIDETTRSRLRSEMEVIEGLLRAE